MKLLMLKITMAAFLALAPALQAAPHAKTYQVTGPVLEVTDSTVTVQKGDEKWQLTRDQATKVKGDLKVGAKVTIEYEMVAKGVEVKADKKK